MSDFDETWWSFSTHGYYNFTKFHQNWMKNKKVLFIECLTEVSSIKVLLSTRWIRPMPNTKSKDVLLVYVLKMKKSRGIESGYSHHIYTLPMYYMDEKCLSEAFSYYLSFFSIPTHSTYKYLVLPIYSFHLTIVYLSGFFFCSLSLSISMDVERKSSHLLIQFCFDGIFHIALLLLHSLLLLHVKLKCGLTWKPCSLLQLEFKSWSIGLASWSMYYFVQFSTALEIPR